MNTATRVFVVAPKIHLETSAEVEIQQQAEDGHHKPCAASRRPAGFGSSAFQVRRMKKGRRRRDEGVEARASSGRASLD